CPLHIAARGRAGHRDAARARVGADELADVRRAPGDRRSAAGDAADARRRRVDAPRRHERPPRAGLPRGHLARGRDADARRAGAGHRGGAAALPRLDGRGSGPGDRFADASGALMLSILTPAFNEATNLDALYARVVAAAAQLGVEWEWLIVDDHSRDDTFAVIQRLAAADARVRGVRLAR